MTQPTATYDREVDAIAVRFAPDGARYAGSEEVAPGVVLDYDEQGRVIGVELLDVGDRNVIRFVPRPPRQLCYPACAGPPAIPGAPNCAPSW